MIEILTALQLRDVAAERHHRSSDDSYVLYPNARKCICSSTGREFTLVLSSVGAWGALLIFSRRKNHAQRMIFACFNEYLLQNVNYNF
jgi:hypothetical protein